MSDVSGIPYMGPMGQGNYFASPYPALTGGGNASFAQTSSVYMPEVINSQNALNNLYNTPGGGGGFGRATDYYSGLGASYSAAGMSPYGVFSDQGGSGGASPYRTTPNVFDTGAAGFSYPGAGAIDWGGLFGGGGASPSAYNYGSLFGGGGAATPPSAYNYGSLFGGLGGGGGGGRSSAADFGAGMFGGLAGGMGGAYQGPNNSMDWSRLFSGGGGGPAVDPYPGMKMPGGLGSPMTIPQQQPVDFGSLFGRGVGGIDTNAASIPAAMPSSDRLLGYTPKQWPSQQPQSVFDTGAAPIAGRPESGGMAAGGLDWGEATGQPYTAPAEPNRQEIVGQPVTEAYNPYFGVTSPYGPRSGGSGGEVVGSGGGLTADSMSEQARARLAEIMSGPGTTGRTAESAREAGGPVLPDTDVSAGARGQPVPLPRERPEEAGTGALPAESPATKLYPGADAPRPPAALGTTGVNLGYLPGRSAQDLQGVNPRFAKALAEYARQYNASQDQYDLVLRSGLRGPGQRFHTSGEAVDINLVDRRNGERLTDYQTRDPVVFKAYQDNANQFHQFLQQNYPDLAQQHRWGGYFWNGGPGKYGSQDIMHHDLGGNRIGMAAGSWKGGLSQRSADAYGLPTGGGSDTPWPKFNFDWSNAPIPDAAPMSPTYKSAGGTRVYQLAPDGTRLPVPIISGNNPSELPSRDFGGSVGPPRPPGDIPAAAPALGRRSDLGASDATEFSSQSRRAAPDRGMDPSYWADVLADDAEPSEGAGLNERSTGMALPAGLDAFFTGDVPKFDPTTFQSPANDYNTFQQQSGRDQLAQRMNFSGFSPSPEPRQGGVGPEMDAPTSEFLRTIAEAESSSNPNKQDKGSQYSGLFQLNKPEFRKYGGTGSIYDADENTKAATGKMMAEGQQAQDILGRALSPVEQYMVHQQGLAGTVSHLRNPDQPAWKSFQQASKWSDERAKTAIWGNLSNNQKAQFGNDVNNITSRDYIELWANKYLEKQVESGQPMTFPGGFSRD